MTPQTALAARGVTRFASKIALDVLERRQQAPERLHVAQLDDVPVARHPVLHHAAVLDDVRAELREGARDVLEQARAVPGRDRDLDAERLRVARPTSRRTQKRSGVRSSARTFGQSVRWTVTPRPTEM